MSDNKVSVQVGPGLAGLLGVAFIILKLTGTIAWPWLWVLSPFWIPVALALTIIVIVGLVMGIAHICK